MAPEALCFQFLWGGAERGERGRGQGCSGTCHTWLSLNNFGQIFSASLSNQSFLNKNASSADESSAKILFKHPSTTFVSTTT